MNDISKLSHVARCVPPRCTCSTTHTYIVFQFICVHNAQMFVCVQIVKDDATNAHLYSDYNAQMYRCATCSVRCILLLYQSDCCIDTPHQRACQVTVQFTVTYCCHSDTTQSKSPIMMSPGPQVASQLSPTFGFH